MICFPSLPDTLLAVCVVKEGGLAVILEWSPIAANRAVECNDRLENAAVVVGSVPVLLRKYYIAALVADEILVVRWDEEEPAAPEPPCTAIIRQIEFPSLPPFHMHRVAKEGYAFPAVADVQP